MRRFPQPELVAVMLIVAAPVLTCVAGSEDPASIPATKVIRYVPPAELPSRTSAGACQGGSIAAGYRADAYRCTAGAASYDPCFATSQPGRALCDIDPRDPKKGLVVSFDRTQTAAADAVSSGPTAWFIELPDGSTCTPLTGVRREIQGFTEVYGCKFIMPAEADGTLGDLDTSDAVWTLQKVLLNKKVEPQTIKSVVVTPIVRAWQ